MSFARAELVRLLLIHKQLVQQCFPTHAKLADLCGVSVRTIKRDLKLLHDEFGAPVGYDYQRRGFHYCRQFTLLPASFSHTELMALCLTLEVADLFRNTPFSCALKGALEKIQLLQPSGMMAANLHTEFSVIPDPMPPEQLATIIHFNQLIDAIKSVRQVRMTYYTITRDAESTRVVDPYHLYFSYGMWYLYAYCHTRCEPRDFAVGRIQQLDVLPNSFTPPDAADLRVQLHERFTNETPLAVEDIVEVTIYFDPVGARWIREREWHVSQRREDFPDGSCTLTMTVMGLAGVRRWILGFGGRHAIPLAPPELVRQVREEIDVMKINLSSHTNRV